MNYVFLTDFIVCFKKHSCYSTQLRFSMVQYSFLLIYLLPTHKKCDRKKNHAYLNLVYSICHRMDICKLVKLLNSCLLLFLVSYPPLTTTLRFPHSSPMNISPGEPIKFLIPFIPIPSSSSSTVTSLFELFPLQ